ncbi:glycosyltransferase family 2 protein [Streptomyces huiliensis]|uniref:glycosyltransferase family 2 protein n=1 Tax=Streptomyces huiliensis TaxID=2876027 RepID=UPI001CBF891E|nr:glycosyltransferase [Streptomyces huiliensis]MBZ4318300.1 glycosyltransferase [Streptomyces huiliensis]
MSQRVGIVIITRDRRDLLLRTLRHLTELPEHPPIVIVDNGSHDGTPAAVREQHPHVRLLETGRNLGAVGRNVGAAALDTPYVAFADDDSWWEPGSLAAAADLFDAHARLALIAATTRVGAEGRPDPINRVLAASPLGRAPDLPGPSVLGFLACSAVVRREPFLEAGGFDPLLHFGGEETLLALELARRGWGLVHCPALVARHHPDPAPRTGRPARARRNELLTAWLVRPLPYALSRTWSLVCDCPGDREARRALAEVLRRLPAALARRRPLPPAVERSARLVDSAPCPPPEPAPAGPRPVRHGEPPPAVMARRTKEAAREEEP